MKTQKTSTLNVQRLTKLERSQFTLSADLTGILAGLILGDLFICKQKKSANAYLKFEQGLVHEAYLLHLYDLFKNYCLSAPKTANRLPDKRTGNVYTRVTFSTCALPCFTELHNLFYLEGKKIIPKNIGDLLTPAGLAYWVADDGTFLKKQNLVVLCTDSYLESDIDLLMSVLSNKFGLDCRKVKRGNGFRLIIINNSLDKLRELVQPHIHNSMLYKLGL